MCNRCIRNGCRVTWEHASTPLAFFSVCLAASLRSALSLASLRSALSLASLARRAIQIRESEILIDFGYNHLPARYNLYILKFSDSVYNDIWHVYIGHTNIYWSYIVLLICDIESRSCPCIPFSKGTSEIKSASRVLLCFWGYEYIFLLCFYFN